MNHALECPVRFLREEQTGLYEWYCPGVPQRKNVLGAKSALAKWALHVLTERGA